MMAFPGPSKGEVVISGFSGRFPLCNSIAEFEHNLYNGVDMVTIDDSRWPVGLWRLSPRNGKVSSYDRFDADFFNVSKDDADFIDPQERTALELTYEAICDSGTNPEILKGSNTGCFIGCCYREEHENIDELHKIPPPAALPTRVSKHFNFKGPLCFTDTACGSSLSALNEAFNAVKNNICDSAVVVGTNSVCRARLSVGFRDLGMINEDGKCKCLSADANGYCRSEAAVVLFLQKKSVAKRIYATILNSRSNSDGYKEEGITFPSRASQTKLVNETLEGCDVDPNEICYVEAHCTGTQAGDPVELNALYDALCSTRSPDNPLYVGCLKSNIGHSEGASGLAAVAKAIIVMEKKSIPPNLHYSGPNTNLVGLVDGRQRPVERITPLKGDIVPINCFGFGGANTHVLLKRNTIETSKEINRIKSGELTRLVVLSSRTKKGMEMLTDFMEKNPSKVTPGFLHLLDSLSTFSSESGMEYKSYRFLSPIPTQNCYHVDSSNYGILKKVSRCTSKISIHIDVLLGENNYILIQKHAQVLIQFLKFTNFAHQILTHVNQLVQEARELCESELNSFNENPSPILSKEEAALTLTITCIGIFKVMRELLVTPPEIGRSNIRFINLINSYLEKNISSNELFKSISSLGQNGKPKEQPICDNYSQVITICGESLFKVGDEKFDDLLSCLAHLHLNNNPIIMTKLYPYEGPVPAGTTFLCNFIKWDHSIHHSIRPYCSQWQRIQHKNSTNVHFHFDKRVFDEEFLFDHIIDERVLFPATGYLMMVWASFTRLRDFSVTPIFDNPVKFSKVHFLTATVMPEAKETSFLVKINQDTGSFIVLNEGAPIVIGAVSTAGEIDEIEELQSSSETYDLSSRDVYKELRVRGYDYGLLFQGIESVSSDGTFGRVCWRHVVPENMRASKKTMDDAAQDVTLWLKNWIPFVDALLQLQILSPTNTSRSLHVPTFLETMICHPKQFNENLDSSKVIHDTVSGDEARIVDVKVNSQLKTVYTKGILLKGIKTSQLNRKPQNASLKEYTFCPYNDLNILSTYPSNHLLRNEILEYRNQLEYVESELKKGNNGLILGEKFYDFNKYAALHNLLSESEVNNNEAVKFSTKGDILFGNFSNIWPTIEYTLLENQLDTVIISSLGIDANSLSVLEVSLSDHIISSSMIKLLDLNIYYDQFDIDYTLAVPETHSTSIKSSEFWCDGIRSHILFDTSTNNIDGNVSPAHLIVLNLIGCTEIDGKDLIEILNNLTNFNLKEGGFVQVLTKLDNSLNGKSTSLQLVSEKGLLEGVHPLRSYLFRKVSEELDPNQQVVIDVGLFNESIWIPKLHSALKDTESNPGSRVWLRPRNEPGLNQKVNGIYGLVKTLRLEKGAEHVRCLIDYTNIDGDNDDIFSNPEYRKLLKTDVMFNVKYDDERGFGSIVHLQMAQRPIEDPEMFSQSEMTYLRMSKPGDLTSFYWSATNYPYGIKDQPPGSTIVDVVYGTLNFKDVMYATGGIPPESAPGMSAGDLPLGLEFSGTDSNNNRVMGMVSCRSLASRVLVTDPEFMWPVPKEWSLEDGATVPVVYATAYYSLIVRGKMVRGESVLIHAAAGGVGLAALNICLKRKVIVFVTVGSLEKRNFLLKEFPDLNPKHIFNSRSTEFEHQLLDITNGRGVDLVLNSLAGDKLQSGLNLLAPNGRFLEIGKVDFIKDTPLYACNQLSDNRSFHGIVLDSLIASGSEPLSHNILLERKQLRNLIADGLSSGEIVPLKRTVFKKSDAEKAFRYLTTGKHIGKVLLEIRSESNGHPDIPSIKQTTFEPEKAYIVVGGLGGFALEVAYWMVQKGARKLILTSRRGIRDSYQQYSINRLKSLGAQIILPTIDTTTEKGVEDLIHMAHDSFGTIGGIFSLATTYRDVMFENQTPEVFKICTESKVNVTYYLDSVSRKRCPDLDYFVCFSSASSGRGNPGQTSYNFGNSIMESICCERVKDGFHGVAIQWGVIGDVGVVAEQMLASTNSINLLGSRSQRMASCLSTLDHVLQRKDISVCLDLVRSGKGSKTCGSSSADLVKTICHIIGIKEISSLEQSTTLGSLGIDSLIAVEIKQTLERTEGLNLSLKQVRDLTVGELAKISSSPSSSTETVESPSKS